MTLLHGERIAESELLLDLRVLLELVNALEGAFARLFGLEHGRSDGAHPGVQLGNDELIALPA